MNWNISGHKITIRLERSRLSHGDVVSVVLMVQLCKLLLPTYGPAGTRWVFLTPVQMNTISTYYWELLLHPSICHFSQSYVIHTTKITFSKIAWVGFAYPIFELFSKPNVLEKLWMENLLDITSYCKLINLVSATDFVQERGWDFSGLWGDHGVTGKRKQKHGKKSFLVVQKMMSF